MHMLKALLLTQYSMCKYTKGTFTHHDWKKIHNEHILCKLFLNHTGQKLVFCKYLL